jgi:hypothetical protein
VKVWPLNGGDVLRIKEFRIAVDPPGKPADEFCVIGTGDVLNINVWKESRLGLRPDGFVTLPRVNENSDPGHDDGGVKKGTIRSLSLIRL